MVVTPDRNAVLSGTAVNEPQKDVMRRRGLTLGTSKPERNRSRARTIGAVFPEQSDGGVPGVFHADPTALTTADAIGDSFRMCTSCQEFALREAIASGRTKTVRDPNFERVFTPSGPHQGGFGRASITKTAKGPRQLERAKPTIRREQALAFPSGVTVAEQSHRPGQTKVRFPSSARHLLPDDVATSDRPLLSRRAPRPSLGTKGGTTQVEGTVTTNDTERRIRFATDEGVVEVTASGGQVQSFHLSPSSASGAEGTMTLSRGERPELVSGAARYRPALGSARNLPALPASTSASSSAPTPLTTTTTTSTAPPSFSLPTFSTTSSSAPPVLPVPSSTSLSSRPSPSPSSRPPSTLPVPSPSSRQTTRHLDLLSDADLIEADESYQRSAHAAALPAVRSASRRAPARLTTTTTTSTAPSAFSPSTFSTTTSSSAPPVLPVPSSTSLSSRPSPSPSSRPPSTLPAPSPSSSHTTGPTFDFSADDAWLLEAIEKGEI